MKVLKVWEDPASKHYGRGPHASAEARRGRAARDAAAASGRPVLVGSVVDPGVGPAGPALPVLNPDAAGYGVAPSVEVPAVTRRVGGRLVGPGESVAQAVAAETARLTWRYRAQLAPFAAGAAVMAGSAVDPAGAAAVTGTVAAAAATAATHAPDEVWGRRWLSARERATAAAGSTGAAAWAAGAAAGWWHADAAGVLAMAGLTGPQVWAWLRGRRARSVTPAAAAPALSPEAVALIGAWPGTIGTSGPTPLVGSVIVPESVAEPHPGTMVLRVQLAAGVHAETATGDEVRRHLERALPGLGHGMVRVDTVREDVSLVQVTISGGRHLERVEAPWLGPVLDEDGSIDLAVTQAGESVRVHLHNDAGVEHAAIFGTTGGGKSNTLVTFILPGVVAHREVLWYVDGGDGTSAAHLAGAADWWAVSGIEETCAVIDAAYAVLKARKARRAKTGRSSWRGAAESDPVLTLVLDEAPTLVTALKELEKKKRAVGWTDKVLELLREGRKLGVRVVQLSQDPMGDDLIGGRKARGLMGGGGALIGHRPGDGTANVLTGSSSGVKIDLRTLPPDPGFCAIFRRGQLLAAEARVRYASVSAVEETLAGFVPRSLDGADAAAAGDAYPSRVTGPAAADAITKARAAEAAGDDLDDVDAFLAEAAADPTPTAPAASTVDAAPAAPAAPAAAAPADDGPVTVATLAGAAAALDVAAGGVVADHLDQVRQQRAASGSQAVAEQNRAIVLAVLEGLGVPLRVADVVRILSESERPASRSTVTRALRDLVAAGHVQRDEDGAYTATSGQVAA